MRAMVLVLGLVFGVVALGQSAEPPRAAGSAPGDRSSYGAPSECPICERVVSRTSAHASTDTVGDRLADGQAPVIPANLVPVVPAAQVDETKATH